MAIDDPGYTPTYTGAFNFVNGASQSNEYTYDKNGNLTKDLNKNISSIQYNFLNLPANITYSSGKSAAYIYDANGQKLRTSYKASASATAVPTDYCGNMIYENGVLKQVLVDGGYMTVTGTPFYFYYLKDHLGSNRVVVSPAGTATQINHYYPFGGLFGESTGGTSQRFKYNGKEFDRTHGLDWYDYGARHMSPDVGRFTTIDPMAEKYYNISPYAYCANSPMNAIDPNGMDWLLARGDSLLWYGGDVGDTSNLMYSFASTSGYAKYDENGDVITSYQRADFQSLEDLGPTPEGEYEINLEPSPNRHAQRKGTEYIPNSSGGIEMTDYIEDGIRYKSPAWGNYRARLSPKNVKSKTKRNMNSFYVHDSEKGYTHGCIEVEHSLFNLLFLYRMNNNAIKVIVHYPTLHHITNGGTKK